MPASWEVWGEKGALPRGPRSGPNPIFFLNWAFMDQDQGSAFHLHNDFFLAGGLYILHSEKILAQKGHVTMSSAPS